MTLDHVSVYCRLDMTARCHHILGMKRHGFLTANQEETLLTQAQNGDTRAAQQIVLAYRPLIARVALTLITRGTRKRNVTEQLEEATQEGVLAVYAALKTYDPARNKPFSVYLGVVIRHALAAWLAKGSSDRPVSLDEEIDGRAENGGLPMTRHDVISDPDAFDAEHAVLLRRTVDRLAMHKLSPIQRAVIARRFLADEPETLQEIAASMQNLRRPGPGKGVSRERVRQIEAQSLTILRGQL